MGTEQYHEPPAELSQEMRTFARMAASLQEEAEAIGWYEQRMSLERDPGARAIMEDAQEEEFKHFAMALSSSPGASRSGAPCSSRCCSRKARSSSTAWKARKRRR